MHNYQSPGQMTNACVLHLCGGYMYELLYVCMDPTHGTVSPQYDHKYSNREFPVCLPCHQLARFELSTITDILVAKANYVYLVIRWPGLTSV